MKKKKIYISSAVTLLSALLIAIPLMLISLDQRERVSEQMESFWHSYLANLYKTERSWEPVVNQLQREEGPLSRQEAGFVLWDQDRRVLFQSLHNEKTKSEDKNIHSIKLEGTLIGYMYLEKPPFPAYSYAYWLAYGASLILIWLITYRLLSGFHQSYLRVMRTALAKLKRVSGQENQSITSMRGQLGYSEDLESWKREMSTVVDRLEDRIARLEKVRRTLSADIVHELRTPLISMKTQLERALVAETRLSPEKMHELFEEVDRMYRLVQNLQNLGLAEAGNLPLSKRWFSLSDNLKVAVEMMKQAAEQAGISLTLEIKKDIHLYADTDRLEQVWNHMLGHCIAHARSSVTVTVYQQDLDAVVQVKDDGIGIEEEELPYIFDRFYFLPGTNPQAVAASSGMGLSLAIVKHFIESHGGQVKVKSEWNSGTEFILRLPVFSGSEKN